MKYRKKPVIIEAFQMTEKNRKSNKDWPKWLIKLHKCMTVRA